MTWLQTFTGAGLLARMPLDIGLRVIHPIYGYGIIVSFTASRINMRSSLSDRNVHYDVARSEVCLDLSHSPSFGHALTTLHGPGHFGHGLEDEVVDRWLGGLTTEDDKAQLANIVSNVFTPVNEPLGDQG